jgi:hypothetical protein
MKIAVTGHTKNLGKFFYDHLKTSSDILGFSRSNGFDIKNPFDRKKIIKQSADCDIFINLVHNHYHQTDILFELFKLWEGRSKLIINISSTVVDDELWGLDRFDHIEYKNQKTSLESMSKILNKKNTCPVIKNYRISEINFEEDFKNLNSIINEFKLSQK